MKIGAWSGQFAQLRQHAAECDRLAEEADDLVARQSLTELATQFRTLADEIDESKPGDEAGEHCTNVRRCDMNDRDHERAC